MKVNPVFYPANKC